MESTDLEDMYNPFRGGNKIEMLVQAAPGWKPFGWPLGEWICVRATHNLEVGVDMLTRCQRPFRIGKEKSSSAGIAFASYVIHFLIICIFNIVFFAIQAYHLVNPSVGIALDLGMFALFVMFAQWLDPRNNIPLAAVLTYAAIIGQYVYISN